MTMTLSSRSFHVLLLVAALFQEGASLSNNNNPPRFSSASEQAMFGGYSTAEASLFGGSSTMYGAPSQPLWKGKAHNVMSAESVENAPTVPFSGDRVESMTFVPSMTKSGGSKSSFVP